MRELHGFVVHGGAGLWRYSAALLHKIDKFYVNCETYRRITLKRDKCAIHFARSGSRKREINVATFDEFPESFNIDVEFFRCSNIRITYTRCFRGGTRPGTLKYSRPVLQWNRKSDRKVDSCKREVSGDCSMENSNTCREPIYPKGERKDEPRRRGMLRGRILRRRQLSRRRDRHQRRGREKPTTSILLLSSWIGIIPNAKSQGAINVGARTRQWS